MTPDLDQRVSMLTSFIKEGRLEEALEIFYSDGIISFVNGRQAVKDLGAHKEAGRRYLLDSSNYRAELMAVETGDEISICMWHYIFDHKEWGHWDKEQVSVQCWDEGKIIQELHLYK